MGRWVGVAECGHQPAQCPLQFHPSRQGFLTCQPFPHHTVAYMCTHPHHPMNPKAKQPTFFS